MATPAQEVADALFEEFGVPARVTPRVGVVVEVTVRRVKAVDTDTPLLTSGWAPTPSRQTLPSMVVVRRSELPGDPSGGVVDIREGPDAGLYDIGPATVSDDAVCWRLPLNPQARP